MPRYKITVEYDGSNFCGWQKQRGLVSVQSVLEDAIRPLAGGPVEIFGAGRTDAGVHATGQVAHFDLDKERSPFTVMQCMNHNLYNSPVSVLSVDLVSVDFHARFSAKMREYRYVILNRRAKPALEIRRAWWIVPLLDARAMHSSSQHLIGTHDLSAFRAKGCQALSPVKTISKISVFRDGDYVYMDIAAPSFLYHQVRNIIGTLYYVGLGKWSQEDFVRILESGNRSLAGVTAPACGLYFRRVMY